MSPTKVNEMGDELYSALRNRTVIDPPTSQNKEMTLDDAYKVSAHFLDRRLADGESLVGYKIGLTNRGVQKYFEIDEPDFGNLTDTMQYPNGAEVPISERLIQPKVEGEIAFVLKRELKGPGVTVAGVLDATDYVVPGFEIVDSRVRDWQIQIQDTVADNGSAGLFVLGGQRADPHSLDLSACEMSMKQDGEEVSAGSGAAALGSPLNCVAWLANTIGRYGSELRRGDIVLSGSLGPVIAAAPGTALELSVSGMGTATVNLT